MSLPRKHRGSRAGSRSRGNVVTAITPLVDFLMEEASGNISDSITGIVLAAEETPTYGVTSSGPYATSAGNGITYPDASSHGNVSAQTAANLGTGNGVIIAFFKTASTTTDVLFDFRDNNVDNKGYRHYFDWAGGATNTILDLIASDGTAVSATRDVGAINDGNVHKLRTVIDRTTGIAKIYIDDVQAGADIDISTLAGKSINAPTMTIGNLGAGYANRNFAWIGTIYRLAVAANLSYNLS